MTNISLNKDIHDYIAIYEDIKVHFENTKWFREEGWQFSIAAGQDKCSLILDKAHWEEHLVYFVTWIGEHELKRNNIKVVLVVEEELPGRKEFVKIETTWNDYRHNDSKTVVKG